MYAFIAALLAAAATTIPAYRWDRGARLLARPGIVADGFTLYLALASYITFVAVFRRPLFALCMVLFGTVCFVVVNRIKLRLFGEHVLFTDLLLSGGLLKHPELYLPYLVSRTGQIMLVLGVMAVALLLAFEPPISREVHRIALLALLPCAGVLVLLLFLPCSAGRRGSLWLLRHYPVNFDGRDAQYGFMPTMYLHLLWHRHVRPSHDLGIPLEADRVPERTVWPGAALADIPTPRPHVLMIQAESFFDIRRLSPDLDQDLLANYDETVRQGSGGELMVPARGAYTMRTEFSALTGLRMQDLGTDSFHPYCTPGRHAVWSLARHLGTRGYATLCVHPFALHFFGRERVMPNLGFEQVHGQDYFQDAPRVGPYVSDQALGRYVLDCIQWSRKPLFIFVITMEAHGPWPPGRLGRAGVNYHPPYTPDWGDESLAQYQTHLRNTDLMIRDLRDGLTAMSTRPSAMCLYGDHIGNLTHLAVPGGHHNANTNYLLWRSDRSSGKGQRSLPVEHLGGELLLLAHGI